MPSGCACNAYLHRKMRSETANGTTNHATSVSTGIINCPSPNPCSMLPRMASIAAVNGSARTTG